MDDYGVWHWAVVILALTPMFPISTILQKAGFSRWWTLLYLVPIANPLAIFVFAYAKWPARP